MRRVLVVSVHDVAPATFQLSRRWTDLLERSGVTATLLVIAGPWRGGELSPDSGFARWLREREHAGHEIAVHGWSHLRPPRRGWSARGADLVARGAAEFALLSAEQTESILARSVERLGEAGVTPHGFTPPGWLLPSRAAPAVGRCGLAYHTDHFGVVDTLTGRRHRVPVVCHRPHSALSELGRWVVAAAPALAGALGTARVALHPADLEEPRLARTTVGALRRAAQAGIELTSYREFLEQR